jgi:hypothetical protein
MRSAFFILTTLLSSLSASLASKSDHPPLSIKLRSVPGSQSPILGVARKDHHVELRSSAHELPKHLALRSVLGLDHDYIGRREEGESEATVQLTGQSYIADVTIGDQEIPVLIDTGSADLWVAPEDFVCLDENHNETSKDTCNIPVYFEGTFSGGVVEDQYFSISCTCSLPSTPLPFPPCHPSLLDEPHCDIQLTLRRRKRAVRLRRIWV